METIEGQHLSQTSRRKIDFFAVEVRRRNLDQIREGIQSVLSGLVVSGNCFMTDAALDTGFIYTVDGLSSREGALISVVEAPAVDREYSFEDVLKERRATADRHGYGDRFLGICLIDREWALKFDKRTNGPAVERSGSQVDLATSIARKYGYAPLVGTDTDLETRVHQVASRVRELMSSLG